MTDTSTEQPELPEALRLADALAERVSLTATGFGFDADLAYAAAELRRLHARVQELEAELEQAKASVSGLKKRIDDWKWRALNAEASQARVPLSDEAVHHIKALTEIARMPNAEYVADAHNNAVRYLHGITQEKQG